MEDKSLQELQAIKRLLLLLLLRFGATSDEIAPALGMHPGSARKLLRSRKVKKLDLVRQQPSE